MAQKLVARLYAFCLTVPISTRQFREIFGLLRLVGCAWDRYGPIMRPFRRHGVHTLAALLVGVWLSACSELPAGGSSSPEALYYAVVQARQQGDTETLWKLLHPDSRAAFDQWVDAENQTQRIIRVDFPEKIQADALKVLTVANYPSGKALFGQMVAPKPAALEGLEVWGAHVRSVEQSGGNATVRTWAGDGFRARQADSLWYATLPDALQTRLTESLRQSKKNLADVKKLAERLKN